MYYNPSNPTRGAVAVPQGEFQTEISEEAFEELIANLTTEPEAVELPLWDNFNVALIADTRLNQVIATAFPIAPAPTIGLPAALAQVSTHGVTAFSLLFEPVCVAGGATTQDREAWASLAESHHLPNSFVEALRGVQ